MRHPSFLLSRPVMFSLSEGEEEIKEREERDSSFQKDFFWLSNPTVEERERFIMWGRISLQTPKSIWRKNSKKRGKKTFFSYFSSPCSLGCVRIAMTFCNMLLVVTRRNAVSRKIRHKNDDERNVMGLGGLGRAFKNFMGGLKVGCYIARAITHIGRKTKKYGLLCMHKNGKMLYIPAFVTLSGKILCLSRVIILSHS